MLFVKPPIFIVGCGRSGTTLMRLILNRHPNIAIPEETWFYPDAYDKKDKLLGANNWKESWTDYLYDRTRLHFPQLKKNDILDEVQRYNLNQVPELISVINRQFARKEGKIRWGDKTPGYVLHLPLLKKLYPDAKVIHMIRDGRDVVPSILRYWDVGPQTDNFTETVRYWQKHVSAGIKDGIQVFGDDYLEIKYENLIDETEVILKNICQFIQEDFDKGLLKSNPKIDKVPDWEWHIKTKDKIDPSNKSKWRHNMSEYHKTLFWLMAGSFSSKLNYPKYFSFNFKAIIDYFINEVDSLYKGIVLAIKKQGYHIKNRILTIKQ